MPTGKPIADASVSTQWSDSALDLLGIRLVGLNATTGHKVLLTIGLLVLLWAVRSAALALLGRVDASGDRGSRIGFWTRQGVSLLVAALAAIGFVSIWFDNPANLTTAIGLVTAGLAFALQRVVTALAGYFVILRGATFTVGDRIVMGVCAATWSRSASFRRPSWRWASRRRCRTPTLRCGCKAGSSPAASSP